MNYCSLADVKGAYDFASTYDDLAKSFIAGVSGDFDKFIRRDLSYAVGVTESWQTSIRYGGEYKHFTLKKSFDLAGFDIRYDPQRQWSDDTVLDPGLYALDANRGLLTVYGMRSFCGCFRIVYNGGYPIRPLDNDNNTVMACPADLKAAAINEIAYRLREIINKEQGQTSVTDGKAVANKIKKVGGMLADVAVTLQAYRRPLG
jgi:hypothetical protein